VQKHEIQATSVLGMFKSVFGMIGGPAVAGLCIAHFGLSWTFFLDLITFIISILSLSFLSPKPPLQQKMPFTLNNIYEAIRYACSRQELLGTYIIDFVAMVCAMPNALFPALATILGGTKVLGWLYSAPAIGALIVTLLSGWTKKIRRHGLVIGVAACSWGSAIICFGFSESLGLTLLFLCAAGAANGVSVIFRRTIWNETIPDRIRGRMASLEMISYTSGPLLGNAHAGVMPTVIGLQNSIVVGGCLCVLGVVSTLILLPKFWGYEKCDHLEKI
jgi:MFS family permease